LSTQRLSLASIVLFALPTIPSVLLMAPLGGVLPAFYAEHTAVSMAALSGVLVFARVLDAITDPLIGYLSDRTRTSMGPRKPWMLAGTALTMICAWPLFSPPADAGAFYFLFWSSAGYLAWTMVFMPYNAWTSELSGDYHERARIFAHRNLIGGVGAILFAVAPLVFAPITGTSEMNADTLRIVALLLVGMMPLCVGIAVVWGPPRTEVASGSPSLRGLFDAVRSNHLLWRFLLVTVVSGIATGSQLSLSFLVLNHLQLGSQFSAIAGASMISGVGSIPLWLRLTKRFGKHKPWAAAMFAQLPVFPVMLGLEPGPQAFMPFLLVAVYVNVIGACVLVSAGAILSDIVDYDTLQTGATRAGSYFAFFSFIGKINVAVSGGLAFFLVGQFGFQPGVANEGAAVVGLMTAFAGVPALLGVTAGSLLWFFPLDAQRQKDIRDELERRAAATATA